MTESLALAKMYASQAALVLIVIPVAVLVVVPIPVVWKNTAPLSAESTAKPMVLLIVEGFAITT
jgi:hypothetical protein